MAKHSNPSGSKGGVDSDRVGRMGGRRGRERSVSGEIGNRLGRGFWRAKLRSERANRSGSKGRGTMPMGTNPRAQRVGKGRAKRLHGGGLRGA